MPRYSVLIRNHQIWLFVIMCLLCVPILVRAARLNEHALQIYYLLDSQPLVRMLACPVTVKSLSGSEITEFGDLDGVLAGLFYWQHGECRQAAQAWESVLDVQPNNNMARFWLGFYYFDQSDYPLLRQLWSDYPDINVILERYDNYIQDDVLRLRWLQLQFYAFPSALTARHLEKTYQSLGQDDLMRPVWRYLAEKTPTDQRDHYWALGKLAELEQDRQAARDYYLQGLQVTGDSDTLYLFQTARMCDLTGDANCAIELYQRVLSIDPSYPSVAQYLDTLCRKTGFCQGDSK